MPLSSMGSLVVFYFFIFLKYLYFSSSYLETTFVQSSFLMFLLVWLDLGNLTDEARESTKFLAHCLFLTTSFYLLSNTVAMVCNFVFYLGFANTIIAAIAAGMFLAGNLLEDLQKRIVQYLSSSDFGTRILENFQYYIVSYGIFKRITQFLKYLATEYLWTFVKFLWVHFIKINSELANNSQSKTIKNNWDTKYSDTKDYVVDKILQPYFVQSMRDAMYSGQNPYKNSLAYNNSMSLLSNIKLEPEDLDDLEEEDLAGAPDPPAPKEEEKPKTKEELRASLRQRIAEQKNARSAKNSKNKANTPQMELMLNNPGIKEMMEAMAKNPNLQKMVAQQDPKNKRQMEEQLKKLMESIGSDKNK